jgi:competence protein ComEC
LEGFLKRMPSFSWTPFVFLRYTFFLSLGIIFQLNFPIPVYYCLSGLAISFLVFLIGFLGLSKQQQYLKSWLFGISGFLFLIASGASLVDFKTEANNPQHILHISDEIKWYKGVVDSEVLPRNKTFKCEIKIAEIKTSNGWQKATGRVVVFQPKKGNVAEFEYGDEVLIQGKPEEIEASIIPGTFDYKRYAAFHQIHHQHFIREFRLLDKNQGNPVIDLSLTLRKKCDGIFKQYVPGERQYSIISALVIGVKSGLDDELKTAYSNAGIMHILAVSGMHVALIFQSLFLIIGRLKTSKYGNFLFAFIVLTSIWFFAFITGLSASVLRAVVMFSFITIGDITGRQKSIYNNFFLSAFALLLLDPFLIMDVGFQLSYLAVLGITYLYPRIYELKEVKGKALDYLWQLTSMSLAAQLVTFPLSIFYFHQFPTYFLLANILLIPITIVAMYAGIVLLFCSFVNILAVWIGIFISGIIWFGNLLILSAQMLPLATINKLHLSTLEVILVYLLMILVVLLFRTRKIQFLKVAFVISIFFACSKMYAWLNKGNRFAIAVHKGSDKVEFIKGGELIDFQYIIKSRAFAFQEVDHVKFFMVNGKSVVIVDTATNFFNRKSLNFKPDLFVVRKNSLKDVRGIAEPGNGTRIVLDDCNAPKTVRRLKKETTPDRIYSVYESGSFYTEL